MLESRINFVLSIITILMVIDHCIYIKTMIALQFPLCSSILTFAPQFRHLVKPLRNGQFWRPKKGIRCPKKRDFPRIHIGMDFFATKKQLQIGQIWPLGPNLHFTGAYRGSPPCTLSQHPNSRETGYSNVLAL